MKLFLVCLLGGIYSIGFTQDWELRKQEDGISVYTKSTNTDGFDSFKASMEIELSVAQIREFLKNMNQYPQAFPDTREVKILDRPNDTTQVQYAYTEAPWPVSDRDGVYELVFHMNRKTGELMTVARALPHYLPEKEGVVRIQKSETYWIASPITENRSKLQYIVHADPGGNIPEWLANSAAVDVPFDTFINIRKALTNK